MKNNLSLVYCDNMKYLDLGAGMYNPIQSSLALDTRLEEFFKTHAMKTLSSAKRERLSIILVTSRTIKSRMTLCSAGKLPYLHEFENNRFPQIRYLSLQW